MKLINILFLMSWLSCPIFLLLCSQFLYNEPHLSSGSGGSGSNKDLHWFIIHNILHAYCDVQMCMFHILLSLKEDYRDNDNICLSK